ncbi:MAG: hypothetical protein ACI8QT_000449 [Halioglobus sp.]|jgi:hypothetical protein
MTTKMIETKHRVVLAAFLATVSLASHAQLPEGQFACQVLTQSGQSGLVLVQTEAEADAVRAARGATAWQLDGGEGKAISVVECITIPAEKFKDTSFDRFYQDFPL